MSGIDKEKGIIMKIEDISRISALGGRIFVYGAVENKINRFLLNKEMPIYCYVDKDESKHGLKFDDTFYIRDLSVLGDVTEKDVVIISTWGHWNEMTDVCKNYGVNDPIIAARDIEDVLSVEFAAFGENIDLYNPIPNTLHVELCRFCKLACAY